MIRSKAASQRAFTMVELIVSTAIVSFIIAALFSGALAMQRCFVGAEDYAVAKSDQSRLTDYIALDLRRALTVSKGTGNTILTVTIPDYYDSDDMPRTPTITKYVADYGNPALPVTVVYQKSGSSILRIEAGVATEIATNVQDFELAVEDLNKVVKTTVSFAPRFRSAIDAGARTGSTVYNTTLLRNKRKL